MCGILGTINIELHRSQLDSIAHRGPDSYGISHHSIRSHHISMGHRRLAIVDLSTSGHQPMQSDNETHVIIYNGEIYNHLDLRKRITNIDFKGHSDTETILEVLTRFGVNEVKNFNGIFAFALLDMVKAKMYLVRDPFGVKPLYYCQKDNSFCWSSELRPLQDIMKKSLDLNSLASLLRLRYLPSPNTLFENIKKVRPGHILELDLSSTTLEISEYPFISPSLTKTNLSYSEAVEQYEYYFNKAINRQMMADVEVGILLSGGIDSALVAAAAQKTSSKPLKAFTIGFNEDDKSDETSDARETAQLLGLEHYVTKISFDDFLEMLKKCVGIVEEPVATTSIIPMYYLAKMAAKHVKVVLAGQGADEPLGGYGRYKGELIRNWFPPALAAIGLPTAIKFGVKNQTILRGLKSLGERDDISHFLATYEVFSNNDIEQLIGRKDDQSSMLLAYYYELLNCADMPSSVERMMAMDLRMNLADDLLMYTDKITMHHSIECRVPILDLELIQFIESLPARFRLTLKRAKRIHRSYAVKVLPTSIINRPKKGFQSPTKTWFMKDDIQDILLASSSPLATYFDLHKVRNILSEHQDGYNREREIFLLLSIQNWLQLYAV